jgi:hypothetical protein
VADTSQPVKGAVFPIPFTLMKSDGTVVANPGTYTKKIFPAGGTIADITNSVTENDTTYGMCVVELTTSETNYDWVQVYITDNTTGTVPFTATIYFGPAKLTAAVIAAACATTMWDYLLSAMTTTGSIGKKLADWVVGTVTSIPDVQLAATQDHITPYSGTPLDAAGIRTAVGLASANLDTQLAALPTDADVNAACDTAISDAALATASSLATVAGYIDTEVAAIKAKTDNLPADTNTLLTSTGIKAATIPAVTGATLHTDYDAAKTAASATNLATVAGYLDTEVAAILAIANKLDTALELDGAVYRFTVNALENGPSGGGGGTLTAQDVWEYATRTIDTSGIPALVWAHDIDNDPNVLDPQNGLAAYKLWLAANKPNDWTRMGIDDSALEGETVIPDFVGTQGYVGALVVNERTATRIIAVDEPSGDCTLESPYGAPCGYVYIQKQPLGSGAKEATAQAILADTEKLVKFRTNRRIVTASHDTVYDDDDTTPLLVQEHTESTREKAE